MVVHACPLMAALGRLRQEDQEIKTTHSYKLRLRVSLKTLIAVFKKKKTKQTNRICVCLFYLSTSDKCLKLSLPYFCLLLHSLDNTVFCCFYFYSLKIWSCYVGQASLELAAILLS